jgi:hypothetical protein
MTKSHSRSRDNDGTFRKKRSDTKVENLKNDYPIFEGINGNTLLGTLEKQFGTHSLDETMKKLKKEK